MAPGEVTIYNKLISEFIGTFMLVFTIACNVLSGTSPAFAVLSIASVLMVMIYALGGVSGAHFNPAVTTTIYLVRAQTLKTSLQYVATQLVSGVTAGFSAHLMFGRSFNLAPGMGYNWIDAALAEMLYTFMLCFVVLNVAVAHKTAPNQYFGLAIGFVIVAGGYAAGKISGGCFNPAVALGIDASSAHLGFGWSLAYMGFELVGAAFAAIAYKIVHPEEFVFDPRDGKKVTPGKDVGFELYSKLTSEFLGTYFLVLTVGLNVLTGSLAAALSIGASLMVMIYALGAVSGAHFNPAVTLAILFSGRNKISTEDAWKYIVVQILGGMSAGFTYSSMTGGKSFPLAPVGTHSWIDVFIVEAIFTFVLSFVVLAVATSKYKSSDMFGLAIGSCVIVGGFAAGSVSGGSLNPAVSIGLDFTNSLHSGSKFFNSLLYSTAEIAGAGIASLAFSQTYDQEYKKSLK